MNKLQNSIKWTKKCHIREDQCQGQQKKTAVSQLSEDRLTFSSIKYVQRTERGVETQKILQCVILQVSKLLLKISQAA